MKLLKRFSLKVLALTLSMVLIFGAVPLYANDNTGNEPSGEVENTAGSASDSLEIIQPNPQTPLVIVDQGNGLSDEATPGAEQQEPGSSSEANQEITIINEAEDIDLLFALDSPVSTQVDIDSLLEKNSPVSPQAARTSELSPAQLANVYNPENYKNDFVPGEVLVGMNSGVITPQSSQGMLSPQSAASLFPGLNVASVEDIYQTTKEAVPQGARPQSAAQPSRTVYLVELALETKESVLDAIEVLKQNPNVAYAEPNYIAYPDVIPNDPEYYRLWGMANIQAPEAWHITTGSHSVRVGVLDSGIDHTHPDLAPNVDRSLGYYPAQNTKGLAADTMDYYGHGTHVAGTIGAKGNNGIGVVGVNWNVTMIPIKIASSNTDSYASAATQSQAVIYSTELGLPIINMSYGMHYTQTFLNATSDYNGLFVVSAGNSSYNRDKDAMACAMNALGNVIFVASSDPDDALSYFSCFGANTVALAAPGSDINSTYIGGARYVEVSGTSMAAPHVAGAAALVLSHAPTRTTAQLKNDLLSSVDAIPSLTGVVSTGGRLNVNRALRSLLPKPPTAIEASPIAANFGGGRLGYSQQQARTITITNAGSQSVTLNPLPTVPNWTLVQGANWTTAFGPNQTRTFTMRPNNGLAVGTHNANFTVTGSGGASAEIQATFMVTIPQVTLTPSNPSASINVLEGSSGRFPITVTASSNSSATIESSNITAGYDPLLYDAAGAIIAYPPFGQLHWKYTIPAGQTMTVYAGTYENTLANYTVTADFAPRSLAVSATGLTNLRVGQAVSGASVVYTLTNATYATSIAASDFTVGNLPPGLTAGAAVRTSSTVVTIPITGTPTAQYPNTRTLTRSFSIPASNIVGATAEMRVAGTITAGPVAPQLSIFVSTTGLTRLMVGQEVSGASVVYTLTGGTYATPITASNFTVGNLPPGLTAGTAVRTSNTVVTIPITGSPTTPNPNAAILTRSSSIPASDVVEATAALGIVNTILASAVAPLAPAIEVTVTGLPSLRVGQAVSGASVVYTLRGGTYATPITASNFTVGNLPAGLTAGAAVRTSNTVVTIPITGTPTTESQGGLILTPSSSIPASNVVGATSAITPTGTNTYSGVGPPISIKVTATGLSNLRVGQAVSDASVEYTLTNGAWGSITPGDFTVGNLPPGLSAQMAPSITPTTVTLLITGTPTTQNPNPVTLTYSSSIPASNLSSIYGATSAIPVTGTITASAVGPLKPEILFTPSSPTATADVGAGPGGRAKFEVRNTSGTTMNVTLQGTPGTSGATDPALYSTAGVLLAYHSTDDWNFSYIITLAAGASWHGLLGTLGNVERNYTVTSTWSSPSTIAVTTTGLTNLRVGQAVSGASVVYTLTGGTYATPITASSFTVGNLPAGLTAGAAVRTSNTVVTIPITGSPATHNPNAVILARSSSIPASNVVGAVAAIIPTGTITASAVGSPTVGLLLTPSSLTATANVGAGASGRTVLEVRNTSNRAMSATIQGTLGTSDANDPALYSTAGVRLAYQNFNSWNFRYTVILNAGATWYGLVGTGGDVARSYTVSATWAGTPISVSTTGLTNLRVGQAVSGAGVVYTLADGTYASTITPAHFLVGNLPPGLSAGTAQRTSGTVVTIPITGTPTTHNAGARTLTYSSSIPASNVVGAVAAIVPSGTITAGAVAKGVGGAVSGMPTVQSATANSVTVNAVTNIGGTGQGVEYVARAAFSPIPINGWQASRTLSGLAPGYYSIHARTAENANYNAGEAQESYSVAVGFTITVSSTGLTDLKAGQAVSGAYVEYTSVNLTYSLTFNPAHFTVGNLPPGLTAGTAYRLNGSAVRINISGTPTEYNANQRVLTYSTSIPASNVQAAVIPVPVTGTITASPVAGLGTPILLDSSNTHATANISTGASGRLPIEVRNTSSTPMTVTLQGTSGTTDATDPALYSTAGVRLAYQNFNSRNFSYSITLSAGASWHGLVGTGGDVARSYTVSSTWTPVQPQAIAVTATGLSNLKAGQAVSGASVVYTLTGGTYATPITASSFTVGNLPPGLTAGTAQRTSNTVVTIPIAGTPSTPNPNARTLTYSPSIPASNVVGATSAIAPTGTISASAVEPPSSDIVLTSSSPTATANVGAGPNGRAKIEISNPSTSTYSVTLTGTAGTSNANDPALYNTAGVRLAYQNFNSWNFSFTITLHAGTTWYGLVGTGGDVARSYTVSSTWTLMQPQAIAVTATGLTDLKVGQAVSGASVVYTLVNGTYATPITASNFTVGNLPPGLTAASAVRTSNTVVTIPISGTPTTPNPSARTLTYSPSIPASNVVGVVAAIAPWGTITASAVEPPSSDIVLTPSSPTATANVGAGASGRAKLEVRNTSSSTMNVTIQGTAGTSNANDPALYSTAGARLAYQNFSSWNFSYTITLSAGASWHGLVGTGGDVARSYTVSSTWQGSTTPPPAIAVTATGLTNLKVGQAVSGASVVYTLANATYASSITPANFTVGNLPAGLTAQAAQRSSATTVTISISGMPTTHFASARTLTYSTSIPASNVSGATTAIAPTGTVTASAIAKGDGGAVSGPPTMQPTNTNTITVNAVTNVGGTGQTVQYAIGTSSTSPTSSWQSATTFSNLASGTYYIFARTAENANYNAGPMQVSNWVAIGTPPIGSVLTQSSPNATVYVGIGASGRYPIEVRNTSSSTMNVTLQGTSGTSNATDPALYSTAGVRLAYQNFSNWNFSYTITLNAGASWHGLVGTGGDVARSFTVTSTWQGSTTQPAIAVTTTGLTNLKVGQAVSGASVVYTLTNGTYATPITPSHFTVGNLPAGLSAGTAVRTSNTVVTIPITGTPTSYNASAATLTRASSIPASNVSGATAAIAPTGTITASAVARGDGAALSAVPTVQSATANSVTVNALSLSVATGQAVEYAISTSNTVTPTSGWQAGRTFSGLSPVTYYVHARSAANTNYNAGAARVSAAIPMGIVFTPSNLTATANVGAGINGRVPITVWNTSTTAKTITLRGTAGTSNATDPALFNSAGTRLAYQNFSSWNFTYTITLGAGASWSGLVGTGGDVARSYTVTATFS